MKQNIFTILGITFLLFLSNGCSEEGLPEDSIQIGNEIVTAIDIFDVKTGALPDNLNEVVPDFLKQIPKPTCCGRKWEYVLFKDSEGESYYLLRAGNINDNEPLVEYNSRTRKWHMDTK